ncbi:NDP-sugar pyrophosphorylase family protein [Bradyrhizobium sp. LB7.2]
MSKIDPTARVEDGAVIGEGTEIGPYCIIGANVVIGANCKLIGHVHITARKPRSATIAPSIPSPRSARRRNRSAIAAN